MLLSEKKKKLCLHPPEKKQTRERVTCKKTGKSEGLSQNRHWLTHGGEQCWVMVLFRNFSFIFHIRHPSKTAKVSVMKGEYAKGEVLRLATSAVISRPLGRVCSWFIRSGESILTLLVWDAPECANTGGGANWRRWKGERPVIFAPSCSWELAFLSWRVLLSRKRPLWLSKGSASNIALLCCFYVLCDHLKLQFLRNDSISALRCLTKERNGRYTFNGDSVPDGDGGGAGGGAAAT